ncbi:hypothetical protein C0995_001729 [Termitomyces sp. Mi166|nr:hypothetical protein C0995_001729 [Termitomyces sp. Mi166\
MHNLFLSLIKEHFHNILGYNNEGKMKKGQERGLSTKGLVVRICYSVNNPCPEKKSHAKDVHALVKWLLQPMDLNEQGQEYEDARSKQTPDDEIWEPGSVFTDEEMKAIADDMEYVTKPS